MKRNLSEKLLTTVMIATFLCFLSCSKTEDQTIDTTNGEKASESENVIQDAITVTNDGIDGSVDGIPNGRIQGCATVSNDQTSKILTIDFGTVGCVGADGRSRKGKIAIQYVGSMPQASATRTVTFTNYTVNGSSVSGVISETGFQRSGLAFSFSVSASGVQVVLSDGRTYTISNLQRTVSVNLGATVQDVADDVTTITGTSTQTGSTGTTTTIEITSAITFKGDCISTGVLYPSAGAYKIKEGNLNYVVDWGTGTCDKNITITVAGKTVTKILP